MKIREVASTGSRAASIEFSAMCTWGRRYYTRYWMKSKRRPFTKLQAKRVDRRCEYEWRTLETRWKGRHDRFTPADQARFAEAKRKDDDFAAFVQRVGE